MKDAVRLRSLFVIGSIGLLLVGMVGSVAAQGPGEQLCHPAGYCVEIPPVPGWSGSFDSTNNILFVSDANETIGYGIQLTYAPGTSGDPASLAQAMDILISSGFSGTPQGDPRPVTLAGFNGLQQPFSTAELGSGMGFVLAVGPDVIAMGVGLRFTGGAWSQVDERGLISFVNSLTVPPTLDATQIIAGGSAPPQVEIFTPAGEQPPPISGTGTGAPTGGALNGSLNTILALRRVEANGTAQVLLATPVGDAVDVTPTALQLANVHILGWTDSGLLLLRSADDTTYEATSYTPVSAFEQIIATGLPGDRSYALSPDGARVISWPSSPTGAAPLSDLQVYDAATMTLIHRVDAAGLGLAGAQFAGWADGRAYFYTQQPGDAFFSVLLESGQLMGPVDLLAAGDGDEVVQQASVVPGSPLALVGRVSAKDAPGVYSVDLPAPDFWPETTPGTPRPVANAIARPVAGLGEVQGVFWSSDGAVVAIVDAVPGDFSASMVHVSDPGFVTATNVPVRAAFGTCVVFTPDNLWLLYVGETGDSLLALPVADMTATPEVLASGQPGLDLCEAAWQPPGAGTGSEQGGVTLGGGGGETAGAALAVGQSVNGTIDDQQFAVEYPLALQAGETVTITMERVDGDLDSLLILLGPDGTEATRNDDADSPVGDSPLNAQIAGFTAPVSGTYTVRATRFLEESGTSSGQYRLSVTAGGQAAPTATPTPFVAAPTPEMTVTDGIASGPAVSIGQTVNGFIGGDVYAVEYPITLQAGETIAVQMEQLDGDLDPFLVIFDPTNEAVAFNDDAPQQIGDTPFNAQIVGYTAQMDGTYFIWATRYQLDNGSSSGSFRLSVTPGTAATATSGGAISVGQSVTGELTTTTFAVDYTIALQAGQSITVTMERMDDTLDPYLSIMDSSGSELASNDDAEQQVGDSSLNAQITDFVAPVNGTYTIRATRYFQEGGSSVGRFQLSVTGTAGTSK